MSKKWWAVIVASFVISVALVATGFFLFEPLGFLENLIAEAIGLALAIGIVVWLIEGPVLSREKREKERIRAIVEYKRRIFAISSEIGSLTAQEIAQFISNDFTSEVDLYGYERGNWEEFEPLLRTTFRRAMDVRRDGLPPYPSLDKESADSIMNGCRKMVMRIREEIDSNPEFAKWEVLGMFDIRLDSIIHTIERAEGLNLLDDPIEQYDVIGDLGERVLHMLDSITPLTEGSELWHKIS